jgi:hypothetical protein
LVARRRDTVAFHRDFGTEPRARSWALILSDLRVSHPGLALVVDGHGIDQQTIASRSFGASVRRARVMRASTRSVSAGRAGTRVLERQGDARNSTMPPAMTREQDRKKRGWELPAPRRSILLWLDYSADKRRASLKQDGTAALF